MIIVNKCASSILGIVSEELVLKFSLGNKEDF